MGLTMDRHRRKAAVQRGDAAPVAGRSPSALFDLVRVLAKQVARETILAQQQATAEGTPMSPVVHDPDGNMEKHP